MDTLPKSVAAYPDECEAVLSFVKDGWIDQNEFDRRSSEWRWDTTRKVRVHRYTGETILLPFLGDPLLAITQQLMREGVIKARRRKGLIEYRLAA